MSHCEERGLNMEHSCSVFSCILTKLFTGKCTEMPMFCQIVTKYGTRELRLKGTEDNGTKELSLKGTENTISP